MPWIVNEDAALKWKLQGLTVNDANAPEGGRPVAVRYRLPEDELANLTYPVVIIEHAGVYPAQERMHSGDQPMTSVPLGATPWWNEGYPIDVTQSPYKAGLITPYNFDYQITVYGRFWSAHIAPLIAELATINRLPAKWGSLWVPQDSTARTMRLLGGPEEGYGTDEDGKRLFKVVYRVRVFAELAEGVTSSVAWGGTLVPVNTVDIDLSVYSSLEDIDLSSPPEIEKNIGILSAGMPSGVDVQS